MKTWKIKAAQTIWVISAALALQACSVIMPEPVSPQVYSRYIVTQTEISKAKVVADPSKHYDLQSYPQNYGNDVLLTCDIKMPTRDRAGCLKAIERARPVYDALQIDALLMAYEEHLHQRKEDAYKARKRTAVAQKEKARVREDKAMEREHKSLSADQMALLTKYCVRGQHSPFYRCVDELKKYKEEQKKFEAKNCQNETYKSRAGCGWIYQQRASLARSLEVSWIPLAQHHEQVENEVEKILSAMNSAGLDRLLDVEYQDCEAAFNGPRNPKICSIFIRDLKRLHAELIEAKRRPSTVPKNLELEVRLAEGPTSKTLPTWGTYIVERLNGSIGQSTANQLAEVAAQREQAARVARANARQRLKDNAKAAGYRSVEDGGLSAHYTMALNQGTTEGFVLAVYHGGHWLKEYTLNQELDGYYSFTHPGDFDLPALFISKSAVKPAMLNASLGRVCDCEYIGVRKAVTAQTVIGGQRQAFIVEAF